MATGSLVSSYQGEPRSSHDIDLVVQITPSHASILALHFPAPEYYLDEVSIREAIPIQDGMFNLLDNIGGDKIDFWILKPDPFDQQCFGRRYKRTIVGVDVYISQPEDTSWRSCAGARCVASAKNSSTMCCESTRISTRHSTEHISGIGQNSWGCRTFGSAFWRKLI
ncbi:MAG: hypothetical protein H7Z14_19230 [Anaerolineae bacterium]|nr:hypothetical protein [Phycisphaerae bacterium]